MMMQYIQRRFFKKGDLQLEIVQFVDDSNSKIIIENRKDMREDILQPEQI